MAVPEAKLSAVGDPVCKLDRPPAYFKHCNTLLIFENLKKNEDLR
jgi:hypothetical protein